MVARVDGAPDAGPFGVYVHFPFCSRRCDYCAFATWTDRAHLVDAYLDALVTDIGRQSATMPTADTIFVGGGTTSGSIGGVGAGQGNLISGNAGDGVQIIGGSGVDVRGNQIYVGGFGNQTLFAYEKGENGEWDFSEPVVSTTTPPKVQGVVVRRDEYVFSSSFGRHRPSTIFICERKPDGGVGAVRRKFKFPNMAEAIVEVSGELIATYESGASPYSRPSAYGFGILTGRMWASTHMTLTPIASLGLAPDPEAG